MQNFLPTTNWFSRALCKRRILVSALWSGDEYADEFDSLQVFFTVRRTCHVFCQIFARYVFALMISVYPQIIVRNVVHLALVGNVGGSTLFSIILLQLFESELALNALQVDTTQLCSRVGLFEPFE